MKLLISAAALLQSAAAQVITHGPGTVGADSDTTDWNYKNHGSDWATIKWEDEDGVDVNACGTGPQSPIDLTTWGSDGFQADYGDVLWSDMDQAAFGLNNLIASVGWDYATAAYGFSWGAGTAYGDAPDFPALAGDEAEEGAEDAAEEAVVDDVADADADAEADVDAEADPVVDGRRRLPSSPSGQNSVFSSIFAETEYGTTQEFQAVGVEFHVGSEHTLDGKKRFDLEMQITLANNPYKYTTGGDDPATAVNGAKLSVLFDVLNATIRHNAQEQSIVDTFFNSLAFDSQDYGESQMKAKAVAFKPMMELLNFNERWMYRGSSTTPPCEGGILWNVLATVYPIRQDTLDAFRAAQVAASAYYPAGTYDDADALWGGYDEDDEPMNENGNHREVQTTSDAHAVRYVKMTAPPGNSDGGFGPAVIFLGIFCAILVVVTIYCTLKYNKRETERFQTEKAAKGEAQ